MNWRALRAIVRKDLTVISRSKGVMLPLIIVPIVMLVAIPAIAAIPGAFPAEFDDLGLEIAPGLASKLASYDATQRPVVFALVYLFAPLYLIVPLMVASVIAADSFAGEKERKTLEALIYAPLSDLELFLAKVCSAWLPALGVSALGFVAYSTVANIAAWPLMQRIFFPNTMWLVLALWVAPPAAGLGLSTMVLVSSHVRSFQEAYQLGSVVVVPIVALMIAQLAGVMYFSLQLVFALGLALWIVDAVLIWLGGRTFRRTEILSRL